MTARVRSLVPILALVLLAAGGAAQAQSIGSLMGGGPKERSWHIGVGGGLAVPVSDAADALKSGGSGQAYFTWAPRLLPWALRLSANYDRHGFKGLSSGQDGTSQLLGALGGLQIGFPFGPIKPYITAGVGAYHLTSDVNGTGAPSIPSTTKLGVDAGAGVRIKIGSIGGFVEGRLQNVFTDQGLSANVSNKQNLQTQIVPVTFGIEF